MSQADTALADSALLAQIQSDLQTATALLSALTPGVTIFGSARTAPEAHAFRCAEQLGRGLAEAGVPVLTGGGPGIMEAANRGASEAGGINIGFNISLPHEQNENPYVTRELNFEFHYFFMRKFWFIYLAKALVVFPGGFGTLDELFESLTLIQTNKLSKRLPIVLYGKSFWRDVLDLKALVRHGTISAGDLDLFFETDSLDEAFDHIVNQLTTHSLGMPGGIL